MSVRQYTEKKAGRSQLLRRAGMWRGWKSCPASVLGEPEKVRSSSGQLYKFMNGLCALDTGMGQILRTFPVNGNTAARAYGMASNTLHGERAHTNWEGFTGVSAFRQSKYLESIHTRQTLIATVSQNSSLQ